MDSIFRTKEALCQYQQSHVWVNAGTGGGGVYSWTLIHFFKHSGMKYALNRENDA